MRDSETLTSMSRGRKRTLSMLAMGVALVLLAVGPALAAATSKTSAALHEENASGVTATFKFLDDGESLRILGKASGMDPDTTYISLIYDNGSPDTGPFACEPTIFAPPPDGIIDRMFVGVWNVQPNGKATLKEMNFELDGGGRVYVSPDDFKTISVRKAITGELQACGDEG